METSVVKKHLILLNFIVETIFNSFKSLL